MSATRSLRRKEDFQKVYAEGTKLVGRLLVLYLLPAADDARAVVASRKIGGAVQRNRAKRLLREVLRHLPRPDAAAGGLWLVAVARRQILQAGSREATVEAARLLRGGPPGGGGQPGSPGARRGSGAAEAPL